MRRVYLGIENTNNYYAFSILISFLHVDMMSFLLIIGCSFCSPENKHDGRRTMKLYTNLNENSSDRTLEGSFIATLVYIYHIFTFLLILKRC